MEQNKKYSTPAEAFSCLSPELQEHSRRVEKYADLIFMELIAAEEYLSNTNSRVRLKTEHRWELGEAARFHDLGKVLVPDFYQWDSPSYSPEEQALYRKHCADGSNLLRELVANEPGATATWVHMLQESVRCHHERWDGTGWPGQSAGESIPVVGRIVAVADALDHLLMNTRSETPVDDAVEELMRHSGSWYDPVIMGLLFEAKRKVEKAFAPYAAQSRAIPKAVRIIRRKAKRPFWLQYRPIIALPGQACAAVEADMCFRRGKDIIDYPQMKHLLREKKDVQDLALAFVLEAADMSRRMAACQVGGSYVALNCVPGFLRRRGTANQIAKLLQDTDTDPSRLCLIVTAEDYEGDAFGLRDNCERLSKLGFSLMVSGVPLEKLELARLQGLHITHARIPAMTQEALLDGFDHLRQLTENGITLLYDDLDTYRTGKAVAELGVGYATGILPGGYTGEDEFITGELALVKE